MSVPDRLHLFEGYGVELEYMIVDTETLDVRPVADGLIKAACGAYESEIERGPICWSNELMLHVVELKTNGPAPRLATVAGDLQTGVRDINQFLAPMGARLMPAAMHPWMQPEREAKLWPHEYSAVFERFDQIFDCTGHGWSNLQSAHLNLPFANDEEFGRLHAAVRLVLPLLPALAASSPIAGRQRTGQMDYRLAVYRNNATRVPSVSGEVIPEAVFTETGYRTDIFDRMYADIAPHDPEGILQHEWLNARGAIARFDRGTVEVRVVDVQECPQADLAIAALAAAVIQCLTESRWCSVAAQQAYPSAPLVDLLTSAIRDADAAVIGDTAYLDLFGMPRRSPCTTRDVWEHLYTSVQAEAATRELLRPIETILRHGPLARRILTALGDNESPEALKTVYGHLCDHLAEGRQFVPGL